MKTSIVFLEPRGTALEVVREAKSRGYIIFALSSSFDLIFNAPEPYSTAIPLIDEVIKIEDWSDLESILKICEKLNESTPISGIYAGMDPSMVACAVLREKYNLPTTKPAAIEAILDKRILRKQLRKAGLSKIRSFTSQEIEELKVWPVTGDLYFKPTKGFFSAYVRKCQNLPDLNSAIEAWKVGSPNDPSWFRAYVKSGSEYHVEEGFSGELMSLEAITIGGKFMPLGLLSRILYSKNETVEMGSCFPYPHPLYQQIVDLVRSAHEVMGFTDGPTHTEVIVNSQGEIEIIDFNPRFVGADVLQSINFSMDIKIEKSLLDFATGKLVQPQMQTKQYACLQYVLCPPELKLFKTMDFPISKEVVFKSTFLKAETEIKGRARQIDYLGCYLTVMPTFEGALERSSIFKSAVKINQVIGGEF